jgi:hypothetical protein
VLDDRIVGVFGVVAVVQSYTGAFVKASSTF